MNRAKRVEVEAQERNLVLVYVEKLAAVDEAAWKDFLPAMGAGAEVPRLFRTPGKVSGNPCMQSFLRLMLQAASLPAVSSLHAYMPRKEIGGAGRLHVLASTSRFAKTHM
jgi:hypothetical protein